MFMKERGQPCEKLNCYKSYVYQFDPDLYETIKRIGNFAAQFSIKINNWNLKEFGSLSVALFVLD